MSALDYDRIYQFRFAGVPAAARDAVWATLAPFLHRALGNPRAVLDPACGELEFLRHSPADERWGLDLRDVGSSNQSGLRLIQGDALATPLPESHFDGVWVSNFLEHLESPERVSEFLGRCLRASRPGGRVAIMGPNFKHCMAQYFDCADHRLILTDVSVCELLHQAGFEIERCESKFLPFSFRGKLPPSPFLVRLYLRFPLFWRIFGKQFLVIGRKPS